MDFTIFFSRWLSHCILRTSTEEIRSNYRLLEKQAVKLQKDICHLRFNETCLNNNLLPCYTNIKLHDDAARNETLVLDFRRNLIKRQIEEKQRDIKLNSEKVKILKQELSLSLNSNMRYRAFIFFLQRVCNKTTAELASVHQRKLINLYGGSIMQKQTKDSVINLSKVEIPLEVIETMSMGMNTHLKQKTRQKQTKMLCRKVIF